MPYLALLACLGIAACSGGFPYRIPIQQGNVITVEMLQELELGMDKRKVTFILGTPLVSDVFHLERWDYFYSYKPGSGDTVQQRASLYFENERLVRINADLDSSLDFHTVTHATNNVLIVPHEEEEGGFFSAVTPTFVTRDGEVQEQAAIERSLDTGFNEQQPGSGQASAAGTSGEVLDPAIAAPATIGPQLEDAMTPSEVYAPNSAADIETAAARSTPPVGPVEPISAETTSQSRFLEQLFDDFATTSEAPPRTAEAAQAVEAEPESVVIQRRDPSVLTRD